MGPTTAKAERRHKKTRRGGFFISYNSSRWLSYNFFVAFNFDLYTTIRGQAVDQCSASFHVVTGVASNRVGFTHTACGDFASRDAFSNQVVNNGLSTFLRQLLVVSFRNRYGR